MGIAVLASAAAVEVDDEAVEAAPALLVCFMSVAVVSCGINSWELEAVAAAAAAATGSLATSAAADVESLVV